MPGVWSVGEHACFIRFLWAHMRGVWSVGEPKSFEGYTFVGEVVILSVLPGGSVDRWAGRGPRAWHSEAWHPQSSSPFFFLLFPPLLPHHFLFSSQIDCLRPIDAFIERYYWSYNFNSRLNYVPRGRGKRVHKHVSFNHPPKSCPLTSTTQILSAFSSSSSQLYSSCLKEGDEFEGLSGSECSSIHFRTLGTIPRPTTLSLVHTTPTHAPKQLKIPTKPL